MGQKTIDGDLNVTGSILKNGSAIGGGTKLYAHEIYFNGGGNIISPLYIVSTKATSYAVGDLVTLGLEGVLVNRDDDSVVYQFIDFSATGFEAYTIDGSNKSDTADTITADTAIEL